MVVTAIVHGYCGVGLETSQYDFSIRTRDLGGVPGPWNPFTSSMESTRIDRGVGAYSLNRVSVPDCEFLVRPHTLKNVWNPIIVA